MRHRSSFRGSPSRIRAKGRRAWGSWLKDEIVPDSWSSIDSGRGFIPGVMALGSDVCLNVSLAGLALRSGHFTTEHSVEAKCDHLLWELDRYKLEKWQLKKVILKKDAAMKIMSTYITDMEKTYRELKEKRGSGNV